VCEGEQRRRKKKKRKKEALEGKGRKEKREPFYRSEEKNSAF
jgi:hypothetical protein